MLVVRESPWPTSALENAARLSRDGVIVMPASPHFYPRPEGLDDLVEHFVDKVVVALGGEPRLSWRSELMDESIEKAGSDVDAAGDGS